MMRSIRFDARELSLRMVSIEMPVPGPDEVRVKVARAGICLSDVHFLAGELPPGIADVVTLGHEVSGTVDAVGSGVDAAYIDENVICAPVTLVGEATRVLGVHTDGAWADYTITLAASLVMIGDLPFDQAAIIPDAVATPWAAITETAQVRPGESAAVWGLGGLGYHAVMLLRHVGALPIIAVDPLENARNRALDVGVDVALDPLASDFNDRLMEATGGNGVDVAFDFFGAAAVQQQAFESLVRGGRLVITGISDGPFSIESGPQLVRQAKQIRGHYGQERRHLVELVKMAQSGRLDLSKSVTAVFPLDSYQEALDQVTSKRGDPIRVLLAP